MEWVETIGKTVEEARNQALERLGVDEQDAEFEVLEEPKTGLFGRVRGEARIRARIVPKAPRPKNTRGRRKGKPEGAAERSSSSRPASGGERTESAEAKPRKKAAKSAPKPAEEKVMSTNDDGATASDGKGEPMTGDAQVEAVQGFLGGLTESFGLTATVETEWVDDELYANITGEGLGLLIGPGFGTLDAVQELTRGVLQRAAAGGDHAKSVVDVVGVRTRRKTALEAFVKQQAALVVETGEAVAFEPMSSPDRKVVHDVANEIDGVATVSEGEDPRRRVVLVPASD